MCHMSHVMCHVSNVRYHVSGVLCQVSCVRCHMSCVFVDFFVFFWDKVFELFSGGSVINGAYPV